MAALMEEIPRSNQRKPAFSVLVVDDDEATRRMITNYFQDRDVPTRGAANRQEMIRQLAAAEPSLIILDLRLGQEDGLDLLREIRTRSDVPIIITTGHRLEEIDRVVGLELGADDYVIKPFGLRELFARVKAVLRRHELGGRTAKSNTSQPAGYRFEGWQLRTAARELLSPEEKNVPLTKSEYALLLAFLEAPQRTLTREQLLQATRVHEDIFDRSIDVQVLRLRRKLERDANAPRMIQTQRGVGYLFAVAVETF